MLKRIQLKRTKGWRMPVNTKKVDRSTRWGNPFKIWQDDDVWVVSSAYKENEYFHTREQALSRSLELFKSHLAFGRVPDLELLQGKDLACWCKEGEPCHADLLLEFANQHLTK